MIARTLCFSSIGKLSIRYEQLVWTDATGESRTFPVEDIGFVVIESEKIEITTAALQFLSARNVAVVICDKAHMPWHSRSLRRPWRVATKRSPIRCACRN